MKLTDVPVIDRLIEERRLDHGVDDDYELLEVRRQRDDMASRLEQYTDDGAP
jgi:hypothetical protein